MMCYRLGSTQQSVDELRRKLETVELKTARSEDRSRQMQRAIEEQHSQQHKLTELFARLLARKHGASTQLEEAHGSVKSIQTENAVCSSSSSSSSNTIPVGGVAWR